MSTTARRRAHGFGLRAESAAAWALRLKGYRVLERRFRSPVGEIDLIARRGDVVAFVEVKARRKAPAEAGEVLSVAQRRRVVQAARAWLAGPRARKLPQSGTSLRFDVILVSPGAWPRHVAGAWTADSVGLHP
ncbi:MAG: YraN family protein [Azospirillaceae bacterium]